MDSSIVSRQLLMNIQFLCLPTVPRGTRDRVPIAANIAFAQSPPGIGRKRPSLPGQPLGDRASAVPFGCRKCFPLADEDEESAFDRNDMYAKRCLFDVSYFIGENYDRG